MTLAVGRQFGHDRLRVVDVLAGHARGPERLAHDGAGASRGRSGTQRARAAVLLAGALTSARSVERLRRFSARLDPYGTTIQVREFRASLDAELL
ncbi:hypothetical protein AB0D67_31595 [Streptosporangium sp. NPDC048047]|uniref:hypothetical protein n=1 Tax=Streptosporangium sp. NPDC048047 TaxID=3155748 RepID=UPI003445F296